MIFIHKQNILLKTSIIILYYTVIALLDFFFAFVTMIILKQEFDGIIFWYANSLSECMLYICSRIFATVSAILIVKHKYEETYICELQSILLVITIIMCFMLRCYQIAIVKMIYESKEQEAGVGAVSLVVILLIILFMVVLYVKNKTLEKEKEFLAMRDEMITQKFSELERFMEKNRQLSHDLKNHLFVLKNLEREGNYQGIHNYIEEIEDEFFEVKIHI